MEDTNISGRSGFLHEHSITPVTVIQVLNIILGLLSLGLWIPGYENQFHGDIYNSITGDTLSGWGNGYKSETLNQFVLAAIIICLGLSLILIFRMIAARPALRDGNRFNKLFHLILGGFLMIAAICSAFGVWNFQENCCHIEMEWKWGGIGFRMPSFKGYSKHCYCYLTRHMNYLNVLNRQEGNGQEAESILYDPIRNPLDMSQFNDNWVWVAHHIHSHIIAVFIIFINSILYITAFLILQYKKM